MGLATPDLINLWGVITSGFFALCSLFLAIAIFVYALKKDKIKGPRLAIFDYKEKEIRSEYTEDRDILVDNKFPKPKWFIDIGYEVLNIGDLTSKFHFHALLTLHDILDKRTKEPKKSKTTDPVVDIFEPGKWKDKLKDHHIRSFGFVFDDIEAHKWDSATIEIIGHFYDKKSNKQPIEINPRVLKNPHPQKKLSDIDEEKVRLYNEQKLKLNAQNQNI